MAQSTARIDVFELDPAELTRSAINAIRVSFGIVGIIGIALGFALLFWPGKSAAVVAALIGIYVLVAGIVRVGMGVFSRGISGGRRTLDILLGLVLVIVSVVALRNLTAAAATILLIAMIVLGISWVIEGIVAFIESGKGSSRGWAITYGIISLLAGIAVLVWPGWTVVALAALAGITFIVLGVLGVVRAFTFGKELATSDS